jgi:small-conductance mechanosensitive channel
VLRLVRRAGGGAAGGAAEGALTRLLAGPLRVLLAVLFFRLGVPFVGLSETARGGVDVVVHTLLIVALTVLASRLITFGAAALEAYLGRRVSDENRRRSIHTQIVVPKAILRAAVVVVGAALVLLQFDVVRSLGVSLLASAGLLGIVVGLAAQRAVSNLLAGIQLTIFQPIRIGDDVVVEGEWGSVEEIGLTNVVVKLWDRRRLVLPVSYFLEKPFQNWTREATDLVGTVSLVTDYGVSVDELRTELSAILSGTRLWDGKVQGVEVTDLAKDHVGIRVLVSAADGTRLWELRCVVREKLLGWLQSRAAALPG